MDWLFVLLLLILALLFVGILVTLVVLSRKEQDTWHSGDSADSAIPGWAGEPQTIPPEERKAGTVPVERDKRPRTGPDLLARLHLQRLPTAIQTMWYRLREDAASLTRRRDQDTPSPPQSTRQQESDQTVRWEPSSWQERRGRPAMRRMLGPLPQQKEPSAEAAPQSRSAPAFSRAILILIGLVSLAALIFSLWRAGVGRTVITPTPQLNILIATLPGSTETQSNADLLAQLKADFATAGLSPTLKLQVIAEQPTNAAAAYNIVRSQQADMLLWGHVRGDLFPGYFLTLTLAPRFQAQLAPEFPEYSLVMATPAHFPLNRVENRGLAKVELGRVLTWLALFYTGHFDRLDSLPSAEMQGNVPPELLQFHWMALRWLEGDYEGVKEAYARLDCPVEFAPAVSPLSPRQTAKLQVCLGAANNRAATLITQEALGQRPASALDGATATLSSVVAAAPDLTTAWYNLGRAYLARGRWNEAVPALDKAVQQAPGLAAAWAALSEACTAAGDLPRAREAATRAMNLDGGLVAAYLAQGRYLLAVDRLQDAEQVLGQALQLATNETTRRRSQEAALREGPQANPRRADFTAAWARRNDVAVARAHLERARVFIRLGEIEGQPSVFLWVWRLIIGELSPLEKAEDEIQFAAVTHSEWSAVRRLKAQLLVARGNLEDAVAILRALQEQDPSDLELYPELINVLRRQWREHRAAGRITEAQQKLAEVRAQYQLLIDRGIAPARGYFGLGEVAQEIEEWDIARESYVQAIALDTGYAEAYLRLAQVELHTPDESLALDYLDQALAAAEEKGAVAINAYCERGEILLEQHLRAQITGGNGPLEGAQKAFEAAHALDVHAIRALNGLGRIAYEGGDVASAERLYRQALAIDGRNFDALYGLGRVYEARGQSHVARDYLFQAAVVRSGNIAARYHLGVAYYALLDEVLARQQMEWVRDACANLDQQKRHAADDIEACAKVEEWLARLSGE